VSPSIRPDGFIIVPKWVMQHSRPVNSNTIEKKTKINKSNPVFWGPKTWTYEPGQVVLFGSLVPSSYRTDLMFFLLLLKELVVIRAFSEHLCSAVRASFHLARNTSFVRYLFLALWA